MNVGAGREPSARVDARRQAEAAEEAERNAAAAEAAAEVARRAAEAPAPQKKPAKEKPPDVPVSVIRALESHFSANNNALAWPDKVQSEELSGTHTLHRFNNGSPLMHLCCWFYVVVGRRE